MLAGLAGDRWAAGLGRLSDDELIGVLRAGRRLASWAAAMELAAVGDLWRRRTAEEDAGDDGVALHADGEVAAALTLTRHAADQLLDLAVALGRLPLTGAALAAGDIDLPRAKVIADEVTGLSAGHAAAVERAVIGAAAGQTTGQLRAATHRAVLAADPAAARRRKDEALRQARVEHWAEPAGTAALAGRDLPPAGVLAADANLTALATQLKAAGGQGTMDALRARIYLALLTGAPVTSLLPTPAGENSPDGAPRPGRCHHTGPGDTSPGDTSLGDITPGDSSSGDSSSGDSSSGDSSSGDNGPGRGSGGAPGGGPGGGSPGGHTGPAAPPGTSPAGTAPPGAPPPGAPAPGAVPPFGGLTGSVNLTLPLATWLGQADTPGHAAGFGPLDATDSRALADALATHAGTRWCLTLTGADGRPLAHGCTRAGPPPSRRPSRAAAPARDQETARAKDPPPAAAGARDRPAGGARDRPQVPARDSSGPGTHPRGRAWTVRITALDGGACDHAWETPAYQPTVGLRHLVRIRHVSCTFPGCRRPAAQCDADHTLAYEHGGRTCLCNLAPLCRHHHQVKQTRGWALTQASPGVLTWTTPAGRRYTTCPSIYPA